MMYIVIALLFGLGWIMAATGGVASSEGDRRVARWAIGTSLAAYLAMFICISYI